MPEKKGKNRPVKTIRIGSVSASIFCNETAGPNGQKREFRNVQLQRSYRENDDWKTSSSFALADMPAAIRCLELALNCPELRRRPGSRSRLTTVTGAISIVAGRPLCQLGNGQF